MPISYQSKFFHFHVYKLLIFEHVVAQITRGTDVCSAGPKYESLTREDEDSDEENDYDYLSMMPEVIEALREMFKVPQGQLPRRHELTDDDYEELSYDYAYVHVQFSPRPIPLRKVEMYIALMREETNKYKDDFPVRKHCETRAFPVIHKVDNVGNFGLLKFEIKSDIIIHYIKFNWMHYKKSKFV